MAKSLKVTIAAGGTAGHINPALALAEELRDRGHSVSFVGQTRAASRMSSERSSATGERRKELLFSITAISHRGSKS